MWGTTVAYFGMFLGQLCPDTKQQKVKVTYSDICKSELRESDRWPATCIENICIGNHMILSANWNK